ncbi:TetR family transcriptional regulator [Skermania sp. ID1734]|uniref:TetR/AcrR family transcriptional regulator n=1 Tax=Skermania sp. ID1734 TaxID=2597516 RepID=UPI00117DC4A4|nr:TetR family transcriptional regulator [Skermania sp. ID1734]TSE00180.1 TetR family transcriptional regulator [Skermania sp. ID1734]
MVVSARERILAAALHIVATSGVAAVSNRRIAAEAEVSLGSITYHFPTQTDLLRESLLSFVTDETRRLQELTTQLQDSVLTLAEAAATVERIARELSFTEGQFATFELYLQAGRDPELRDAAARCFAAYDDLAATVLGALGVPEPERRATAVVAAVTGAQLRRLATGSDPTLAAVLVDILGVDLPQ